MAVATCYDIKGARVCIGDWIKINGFEGFFLRLEDRDTVCIKPVDPIAVDMCIWGFKEVRVLREKRKPIEALRGTLLYYLYR